MDFQNLIIQEADSPRSAFITGGTGTLGEATVRLFASRGWQVMFQYGSNEAKALHLEKELQEQGCTVKAIQAKLTSDKSNAAAIANGFRAFAGDDPDLFAHCPSTPIPAVTLGAQAQEAYLEMHDVHIGSFLTLVEQFLPRMKTRQSGYIVGVLSEAVDAKRISGWSAYAATKAALASFLIDIAAEAESTGVQVAGLVAGAFQSSSPSQVHYNREMLAAIKRRWPLGVSPEVVAQAVVSITESTDAPTTCQFISITANQGIKKLDGFGFQEVQEARPAPMTGHGMEASNTINNSAQPSEHLGPLRTVLSEILEMPNSDEIDNAHMGQPQNWDSLRHLKLLMSIETEFACLIPDERVGQLTSFQNILEFLDDSSTT